MTAPTAEALVTLQDLEAAADGLRGIAVRTPLLPVDALTERFPAGVWVKPEMLQRTGAFKFRGAYTFLRGMSAADRARGVIAPSSGNHGQAVAYAARMYGVACTVVMPTTVTATKRAGAERYGATVELAGTTSLERAARAEELAAATGAVVVPPFDDVRIIAGQGTLGLEIADDLADVVTVLVPVGGGGLSSGVATAIKLRHPNARIVGVEPSGARKLSSARAAGAPVTLPSSSGLPDGLLGVRIGTRTFAHLERFCDDIVQVDDAAIRCAMRFLLDRMKLVAEPSGAITMAALTEGIVTPTGPAVAVLSGGNIEWGGLMELIADPVASPSSVH
ncbi:MAG: threonine/serine dehydratase [Gemmatimonadaceae bacterium]|nr:threonine/serine dehydratase [Gemmatimonadaceae bacterium]